ncbi:thioredoxin family protein [Gangjinia marincola]|uniref:Thioredoxin family protein n=1 Tax=Gangjinia marincola TaxID=578463 RepID=A0ABN1MGK6_9FLAO
MKHTSLYFILFSLTASLTFAQFGFDDQVLEPLTWEASLKKIDDTTAEAVFTATMDDGWHLPSQQPVGGDGIGPTPTQFTFTDVDGIQRVGKVVEPTGITKYDEVFEKELIYFEGEVSFIQRLKITDPKAILNVEVLFSVCDDMRCLPPEIKSFSLSLLGKQSSQPEALDEQDKLKANGLLIDLKQTDQFKIEEVKEESYLSIFLLGFVGGLIALLTPCVFPMIPLTVSFFTKSADGKGKGLFNAMMYGFFILLIYVLLSVPFHVLDSVNPEFLNTISTNVTLNIVFFLVFIFFAFSFFGYYEITLPASWSAKMDAQASSVGGVIGIFFMALTLALVSFSCTGPILGSLLGGSLTTDGGAWQLTAGMGGFGLALALPFALFALFPNWLNNLPKSGGWLNTVKVVLGFIELGLAFKFLSNADLVEHWGLLKREIFIGIWLLVGIGLMLYLFGVIRFPHDDKTAKIKAPRKVLGVFTLMFVIYLVPGLSNTVYANLKLLSGFPPPLFYSVYDKDASGPLGLKAYKDFDKGLAAAKEANKPILLDFTGWACVNCRKMEEQVWSVPQVYETIKNNYILISLYVDDREELPQEDRFSVKRSNGSIKEIRTIGDQWATFQTLNFKNNSQPYYVLLSPDLGLLNTPKGYTPNAQEFLEWLKVGSLSN